MGITFSVSQMNKKDKELMKKSIESHGGIYSGKQIVFSEKITEVYLVCKSK